MELVNCAAHGATHDLAWLEENDPRDYSCKLSCTLCHQDAHGNRPLFRAKSFKHNPGSAVCELKAPAAEVIPGDHEQRASTAGRRESRPARMVFNLLDEAAVHRELDPAAASAADQAVNRYEGDGEGSRDETFNLRQCLLHLLNDPGWLPPVEAIEVPERAGPGQAGKVRPEEVFRSPAQITDNDLALRRHLIVWFPVAHVGFHRPERSEDMMYFDSDPQGQPAAASVRLSHKLSETIRQHKQTLHRGPGQWLFRNSAVIAFGQVTQAKGTRAMLRIADERYIYFLTRP